MHMVKEGHLGGHIRGGDPGTWCPKLWKWLVDRFGAESVLDVGCGEGHSTRYFADEGCRVLGVEGSQRTIDDGIASEVTVQHDYCDGAFVPEADYDLIWSCEFLEHVEEQFVPNILATFAHAQRAIAVTHAFPGQMDGHHHVNCQPTRYWIRQIEPLGFRCDVGLSLEARRQTLNDYRSINHFARSGLIFVRDAAGASQPAWKLWLGSWVKELRLWAFKYSAPYRRKRQQRRQEKRQQLAQSQRRAA